MWCSAMYWINLFGRQAIGRCSGLSGSPLVRRSLKASDERWERPSQRQPAPAPRAAARAFMVLRLWNLGWAVLGLYLPFLCVSALLHCYTHIYIDTHRCTCTICSICSICSTCSICVCVCACVNVYIYIHNVMYICIYIYTHIFIYLYTSIHVLIFLSTDPIAAVVDGGSVQYRADSPSDFSSTLGLANEALVSSNKR